MCELIQVDERESNQCPYCFMVMEPWEGASEMGRDGKCIIWCHYCGEEYFYMEKKEINWGFAVKLCHECGGEMILDEIPGPDIYPDLEWSCTKCGINELHSEFLVRTKRSKGFY